MFFVTDMQHDNYRQVEAYVSTPFKTWPHKDAVKIPRLLRVVLSFLTVISRYSLFCQKAIRKSDDVV